LYSGILDGNQSVAYMTWGTPGPDGQISGNLSSAYIASDGSGMCTENAGFNGRIIGTSLTATISGAFGYSISLTGTVGGGTLTLTGPLATDGGYESLRFTAAGPDVYNADLAQLSAAAPGGTSNNC
jgi:hypothetical protein